MARQVRAFILSQLRANLTYSVFKSGLLLFIHHSFPASTRKGRLLKIIIEQSESHLDPEHIWSVCKASPHLEVQELILS
jgi:hypothetical protein